MSKTRTPETAKRSTPRGTTVNNKKHHEPKLTGGLSLSQRRALRARAGL